VTSKKLQALAACAALMAGTAAPACAIDPAAGTGGASFMKLGLGSARALALGQAYVALAEGADAMTWNPAGLALSQQREFVYSHYSYVQEVGGTTPLSPNSMYMGYAHPLGRTVFGGNFGYLSIDGFDVRDELGRPLDSSSVRVQNGFGAMSVARSFWYEKLFLGGSLRAIHSDNAGTVHDVMVGDAGALLRPNQYVTFGVSAQNLGAGVEKVAQVTRVGMAGRVFDLLTLTGEFNKANDNGTRVGLGFEFILPEDLLQVGQLALRAGFHNADDLGQVLEKDRSFLYPLISAPQWSFGIGLYTSQAFGYGFNFDYTMVSMGALGTGKMMSLKVKF
jgi:hypothetical protein